MLSLVLSYTRVPSRIYLLSRLGIHACTFYNLRACCKSMLANERDTQLFDPTTSNVALVTLIFPLFDKEREPKTMLPLIALLAYAADIYVSPTGSDSNAGTQSSPFKTLAKAQTATKAGDTVNCASGIYPFSSPLELTKTDSDVTWIGAGASISGGVPVTGWTAAPSSRTAVTLTIVTAKTVLNPARVRKCNPNLSHIIQLGGCTQKCGGIRSCQVPCSLKMCACNYFVPFHWPQQRRKECERPFQTNKRCGRGGTSLLGVNLASASIMCASALPTFHAANRYT